MEVKNELGILFHQPVDRFYEESRKVVHKTCSKQSLERTDSLKIGKLIFI